MTSQNSDDVKTLISPSGTFEIHSAGAHITRWDTPEFGPVLFVSKDSGYGVGTAIRGGIPLCMPWFGRGHTGTMTPSHGFGRLANWRVLREKETPVGEWTIELGLNNDDVRETDGAQLFPNSFEATYTATFAADSLHVSLTMHNTGTEAFLYEEALHTYFAVGDITQVEITGLEMAPYEDSVTGDDDVRPTHKAVTFTGETDRVYSSRGTTTIIDKELQRLIKIEKANSAATVVWNPWSERAAAMKDLGNDEWRTFVCVESANIGDDAITIQPGASHTISATYTVFGI
ncbi:D-hexose-6-phosphate mutarotase [Timonella sp. A28]|uniref:D-hexose-6-phosphate mutarotase n=1 Tax=Timonella sp. A28 TaxID=3442640 RepID=UPI003EBE26FA